MKNNNVFVIDTNTLISASLLKKSVARQAFDKAMERGIIAVSHATLNEFSDTFVRSKFDRYLPLEVRLEIIERFKSMSCLVNPKVKIDVCRDSKDNQFLELAISCNAKYIISSDADLLVLNPYQNINIVSPRQFLEELF